MTIGKSSEDYLEAILVLGRQNGTVRSVDVAHHMAYSKPSVSRAVAALKADGLIEMMPDGALVLTKSGQKIAEGIYERHTILTEMLTSLGVSPATAAADACLMEHVLSEETFDKIKAAYRQAAKGAPKPDAKQPAAAESVPGKEAKEPREGKDGKDKKKKKKKKK